MVIITAVFACKAFVACQSLDKCSADAEVFGRKRVLSADHFKQMVKQFNGRASRRYRY